MMYFIIPIIAAGASLLTFFSGFGLGTLLTPVFAVFFPVEIAIGLTAVVHFLNGLFKLTLVGKFVRKDIVFKFGIPAVAAALVGAYVLSLLSGLSPLHTYEVSNHEFQILPIKLIIAILIVCFTFFELHPTLKGLEFGPKYLSAGGIISGFFGGLSGHQGALSSAFLSRAGLTKEEFVGTGTLIGSMIDLARIGIYSSIFHSEVLSSNIKLLTITTLCAFAGAYAGNRLLKKITMSALQNFVSITLLFLAIALGLGII